MSAFLLGSLPACAVPEATAQTTAAASRPATTAAGSVRHIALQGAVNVRDLGGYRTGKGRQVRYGQVFRADALARLTDRDLSKLSGLKLRTVVDFRLPAEVRRDGADRLPEGVTAASRPVDDLGLYARTTEVIGSKDPVEQQAALGDGKAERMMRSIYRTFVTDADNRRQFATVVRDVARAKGTHRCSTTAPPARTAPAG
ncbi:tyrosine-protein phosphatase [Streptomyces sp. NPDC056296]|uniref:tyrosine-protein phosphatase n=1 Tax=Streptomyces sp. NPDC056296 TaxID=3345775 RepID=UPI0035D8AA3E